MTTKNGTMAKDIPLPDGGKLRKGNKVIYEQIACSTEISIHLPSGGNIMVNRSFIQEESPTKVDSTSDERTTNNVMRHEYRKLSDDEKQQMKEIKDKGLEFVEYLNTIGTSRELSLATTKMEEAVMWAVKHITR